MRCLLHHARGIADTDDMTESSESSEMNDDPIHIYCNVQYTKTRSEQVTEL